MSPAAADAVRSYILDRVGDEIAARGLRPDEVPDDYDLLAEGVIDSFGIVDLISALESEFGVALDFDALDPDAVTRIGPLSAFVADRSGRDD